MEKLALRSSSSQAKIIGTIVSISGAFVVTLYKGPPIILTPSPSISLHQPPHPLRSSESSWIIGALFLSVEYFLTPVWYIVQVWSSCNPHKELLKWLESWVFPNFKHGDVFAGTHHKGVPLRTNCGLFLQLIRVPSGGHCWFGHRTKLECLDSKAKNSIGFYSVLGEKLMNYHHCSVIA